MDSKYRNTVICLGLFVAITIVFMTSYALVQQNYRMSANDPQIQMAEDAAAALNKGRNIQSVVLLDNVDISKSLGVFLAVYDDSGKPVMSSGYLNGNMPTLPQETFNYARKAGEGRFTWQPEKGVRQAAVLVRYDSGFVLASRSLREVEIREDNALKEAALGWLATIIVGGFVVYLFKKNENRVQ